jgi:hypothetical protein
LIKEFNSADGKLISYKKTTAFTAMKSQVTIGKEDERTVSRIGNIQATKYCDFSIIFGVANIIPCRSVDITDL